MEQDSLWMYLLKKLLFGIALTIGLFPFKNSVKDVLFTVYENNLVISGIFYNLLIYRKPLQTLIGFLLIYIHIALVFIDMNILLWMGTTLNNNMIQNMLESKHVGKSLTDENWILVYVLVILAILPQIFVYFVKYLEPIPKTAEYTTIRDEREIDNERAKFVLGKIGLVFIYVIFLCERSYSPISNAMIATFLYTNEGAISFVEPPKKPKEKIEVYDNRTMGTNLIYIMNESLGNFYLMDQYGNYNNATFFKNNISESPGTIYNFNNTRSVSGNTETAMVALSTGLFIASLPRSTDTSRFFRVPSLAAEANKRGYQTALYCSFETHFNVGWTQLNSVYGEFEHVVSRTTLKLKPANDHGIDDRIITEKVIHYLQEKSNSTRPFFLVIIWNNLHTPFLVDGGFVKPEGVSPNELEVMRANYSLGITDNMLESVLTTVKNSTFSNNTVIAFSADHGEQPGLAHDRIANAGSSVLSVPMWFDVPDYLLNQQEKSNLTINSRERLASTLDIVPTLMDIMKWRDPMTMFSQSKSTVYGQSLLRTVEPDRYAYGWAGKPFVSNCGWTIGFFFNATHNLMVYEKNNIQLERVGSINHAYKTERIAFNDLSPIDKEIWSNQIKKHSFVQKQLKFCGLSI
ncbi:hypothetical protein HK103_001688 [Boothiomyces macroporosus]|uniref:Sulfatase N-terminal domain-containing protein n=1 Tax=Boothiomyces macroporosus TaxID=261099 RepID=A0AAD5UNP7_9FUNG|nr:hypothetical protein HK103_001688 [Boothiomyces macroporosus]